MQSSGVTPSDKTLRLVGLSLSSTAVIALAMTFDILADEPPTHTVMVLLAAATVGLGRYLLRGRLTGVFVAVNLAVIGQPAVHALTKLTHVGADALPHSHALPENFFAIALHIVIAVLVVAVAASEPLSIVVARVVLHTLVFLTRASSPSGPTVISPHRREGQHDPPGQDLLSSQSLTRRGPPVTLGRTA